MTPVVQWSAFTYQGFAEQGRVSLIVFSDGRVDVSLEKHAMVPMKNAPWSKSLRIDPSEAQALFERLHAALKTHQRSSQPLQPGMDVVEKSFEWFSRDADDPAGEASFVETPPQFEPLLVEMKRLFDLAKPK